MTTYLIASAFFSVYEMAIDPLFLCFLGNFFLGDILKFLVCVGREEAFYYQIEDFYIENGFHPVNNLPIYHPLQIFNAFVLHAFIFVVPVGYYKIYKFIEDQNKKPLGQYNL